MRQDLRMYLANFKRLLRTQRLYRVDARSTRGRQPHGDERNPTENESRRYEHGWVPRLDATGTNAGSYVVTATGTSGTLTESITIKLQ